MKTNVEMAPSALHLRFSLLTCVLLFLTPLKTNCQEDVDGSNNKNLEQLNYKDVVFTYPPHIQSERDIPICAHEKEELSACNIVNKRYFYPPTIERLCRCQDRSECPWEFSDYKTVKRKDGIFKRIPDPKTLMLSSRAQLKFCGEASQLPKCIKSANETSLRVIMTEGELPDVRRIISTCFCPPFKRWILQAEESREISNGTEVRTLSYTCDKLPRCAEGNLCGHVRPDTYSTYFLCSCPLRSWCYPRNFQDTMNVTELLYSGPVIKAYCNRSK